MASGNPIMSQLRTSLKDNLLTMCSQLSIEANTKDTRVILQSKIEEFSRQNDENCDKVRDLIIQMKNTPKERHDSQSKTNETHHTTQNEKTTEVASGDMEIDLTLDSQPPLFDDQKAESDDNGLKRALETDNEEEENAKKRPRAKKLEEMENREILEALYKDIEERERNIYRDR